MSRHDISLNQAMRHDDHSPLTSTGLNCGMLRVRWLIGIIPRDLEE